jgi:hypothetical protein
VVRLAGGHDHLPRHLVGLEDELAVPEDRVCMVRRSAGAVALYQALDLGRSAAAGVVDLPLHPPDG